MSIIILGIIGLIGVASIAYFMGIYNSFIRLKNNIDKSFKDIDIILQQRHDELTKLMSTVKSYKNFEKSTLENITKLRSSIGQSVSDTNKADNMMTQTLKSIFAVAENYPELKADKQYQQLSNAISKNEETLSDRREFYNATVNTYNIRLQQIPDVIIARMLGYQKQELLKIPENKKEDIEINLD